MKKFLNNNIFSLLSKISKELDIETFVVGGFVRDCLIGKKRKLTDIDIVCNEKATDFDKAVLSKIEEGQPISTSLGTAPVAQLQPRASYLWQLPSSLPREC